MSVVNTAADLILQQSDLDLGFLDQELGAIRHADFADFYLQQGMSEAWSLEDGIVKDTHSASTRGVGVRVIAGDKVGFAYSGELSRQALLRAIKSAGAISAYQSASVNIGSQNQSARDLYTSANVIQAMADADKIALLQTADRVARAQDPRVVQVFARLSGNFDAILVAASQSAMAADLRPLVRMDISVIVEHNGRREQAHQGGGGRFGYGYFTEDKISQYCREAVRVALLNLEAIAAPAGQMPVVLGAGWTGVLLHEAVGHGLEGDFNRKGTSNYSGAIGTQVAAPLCTIVDDGTLEHRRGSLNMDDEGVKTQQTILIENGILKNYMQDKHNAALMGMAPTGNGRRQSYAHLPMPRMTNTYMLAGQSCQEEMIASVKKGIFAANFSGGQVDITSGQFVFSASEAYLIENGKLGAPIKGATLIGNGPKTMGMVSMVGNDLRLDEGVGVCGKNGQSVPVGVGQPSLKIDQLTVGGTAA